MRVHAIQHVRFENPAMIAQWADARGHELTTSLAPTEGFPDVRDVDLLVVLGGPMAADDEDASPWLLVEKHYLADYIATGGAALGICLGAQIIAEVLGGTIRRCPDREIGWFPVDRTEAAASSALFADWPERLIVGQWHGDTFDLPAGLPTMFASAGCCNQAFVFDSRVVGLQFHIEWTEASLAALIDACGEEAAAPGRMVMPPTAMEREAPVRIAANRDLLFGLLDRLIAVGVPAKSG